VEILNVFQDFGIFEMLKIPEKNQKSTQKNTGQKGTKALVFFLIKMEKKERV